MTLIVVAAIFLAIPLHQVERNTNVKACDHVTSSVLTDPNTRVFIAYGQSNADCCGEPGYAVRHPDSVIQYFDGRVYRMREPMLGAYCRGALDSDAFSQATFFDLPEQRIGACAEEICIHIGHVS